MVGWLVGCLVGWLGVWLVGWLIGWLVGCVVGWLVGWLVCASGSKWGGASGASGWLAPISKGHDEDDGWLVGWLESFVASSQIFQELG